MIRKSPTKKRTSKSSKNTNICNPETPITAHGLRDGSFGSLVRNKLSNPLISPHTTPRYAHDWDLEKDRSPSMDSTIYTPLSATTSISNSDDSESSSLRGESPGLHQRGSRTSSSRYNGSISVSVRIKPSYAGCSSWQLSDDKKTLKHGDAGEFSFDNVFDTQDDNHEIYETIGRPIVDKLFEGFNATIFAYGMTGSGKTFTMSGVDSNPGLIALSVEEIFARISCESGVDKEYEVKVSYLQIYNEKVYDLLELSHGPQTSHEGSPRVEVQLREDSNHGITVVGLNELKVSSSEEMLRVISAGDVHRRTGETDFNSKSSRSHAVVSIVVECSQRGNGYKKTSTLSLCDLAGSEKAAGQQDRRKEGAFINKSLLALGNVISKLGTNAESGKTSSTTHVPYRNSKLTRFLQPTLNGESIVTTICTIDSRPDALAETINTLRFALRAKNVAITAKKNETFSHANDKALIQKLNRQIEEQNQLIARLQSGQRATELEETAESGRPKVAGRTETVVSPSLAKSIELLHRRPEFYQHFMDNEYTELRDQELLEIADFLPAAVGSVFKQKMRALEARLNGQVQYIQQLELRSVRLETKLQRLHQTSMSFQDRTGDEDVIRRQEQELLLLRKSVARKDKMLEALRSAKRLRDSALRPECMAMQDN
ncbi:LAMI_0F04302g1_1 [Lachancea mirantina]|uniref:Kinesin-like protein n=1 Tax=Lachancea mirantina TaxID=1230905 RepID=A0A1G4JXN7_9SACH|nr:LAMI_0F04302g1_1 [Lachancea mirantina]